MFDKHKVSYRGHPLDCIIARRFSAEEKYNWLKVQNKEIKKYLSQWSLSGFFDESVEKLMTLQQDDWDTFVKLFY